MKENDKVFNSVHGIFVPVFYWENFEDMPYYYDENTNSLICGNISVRLEDKKRELTKPEMRLYIEILMENVKTFYRLLYNIELVGADDEI